MKATNILLVVLLAMAIVACAPKTPTAPEVQPVVVEPPELAPTQSDVEQVASEVESIEADIADTDVDALDEELAELEALSVE